MFQHKKLVTVALRHSLIWDLCAPGVWAVKWCKNCCNIAFHYGDTAIEYSAFPYVLTVNSVCSMKLIVLIIMIGMRLVFSREQSLYYPSSCIEML